MSYNSVFKGADIDSLLKAVGDKADKNIVGSLYKAAWTATECTKIGEAYTEALTLPAGTYIINVVAPYCADFTARVCINFSATMMIGTGATFIDAAYGSTTMFASFSNQTNLRVLSGASANKATWSYLERGGLVAMRIK